MLSGDQVLKAPLTMGEIAAACGGGSSPDEANEAETPATVDIMLPTDFATIEDIA